MDTGFRRAYRFSELVPYYVEKGILHLRWPLVPCVHKPLVGIYQILERDFSSFWKAFLTLHYGIRGVEVQRFPIPAAPIVPKKVVEDECCEAHEEAIDTRNLITAVLPSLRFNPFKTLLKHGFYQDQSEKTNFTLLIVY
jgi:hypothetical protein